MCGIIALTGRSDAVDDLLTGLKNLEYRGYDSAGIAVKNGTGVDIRKCEGTVDELVDFVDANPLSGPVGIGHTRWSTHGPPSDRNAHPHTGCNGDVAVVHNGIIGNHDTLRTRLESTGHVFESETDTEVVPHLIEEELARGSTPEEAFRRAVEQIDGSYAIVATFEEDDALYATRSGSPLVLGIDDGQYYLASDVPAFLDYTDEVVYLEDGDVVVVEEGDYRITTEDGEPIEREVQTIDWSAGDAAKGSYDHFMLKEINEQPSSLRQTVGGRFADDGALDLEEIESGRFEDIEDVHLVGCGTSYHAGLQGTYLLSTVGVRSQTHLASEFVTMPPPVDERSLVVGVTQSGETADTLEAIRQARRMGAKTLAVTNSPGSTAVRECDDALFIQAGPEIGVAATKTFSSQVVTLLMLAERLANDITGDGFPDYDEIVSALESLPDNVQQILDTSQASSLAQRQLGSEAHFFIGRGSAYPIALEGALKFKEITYEHAEGFAAGELKHGPLALVNPDTPVYAIVTDPGNEKTLGNIREVQARGAWVVVVASERDDAALSIADESLTFPHTHPLVAPVMANVQLQLISYHVADALSRSIDKPRNLAKSVTVE